MVFGFGNFSCILSNSRESGCLLSELVTVFKLDVSCSLSHIVDHMSKLALKVSLRKKELKWHFEGGCDVGLSG